MEHLKYKCDVCGVSLKKRAKKYKNHFCSLSCRDVFRKAYRNANFIKWFESMIYYSIDGCWYWLGTIYSEMGYGAILFNNKKTRAHRFSYEHYIGKIPNKLHVLHRCDNPLCVNPNHLFIGTASDNMKDKVKKGRSNRGNTHPNRKLTEGQVIQIRNMSAKRKDIANMFGVVTQTIDKVINRQLWKHI